MMNCKPGEIVSFPFIDKPVQKLRSALVLSNNSDVENGSHLALAMIPSTKRSLWDSDIVLKEWRSAGLKSGFRNIFNFYSLE